MICRRVAHPIAKGTSRVFLRRASDAVLKGLRPLENFTRRLINASATGDASYNHRDAEKLLSVISQANPSTPPLSSIDKAQFLAQNHLSPDRDTDPLGLELPDDSLKPGTFVELRRNRVITHGIVLDFKVVEGRQHSFTLTYTGEVWPHLLNDITYAVPNFVSQDLMERAGDDPEALSTAQARARLQIVEQIRTFTRQHERHFTSVARDSDLLYDTIRNRDPHRWADITTPEATRVLDVRGPPPVLTLFAMHTYLMSRPMYFVADPRSHKTTHRFSIRPLAHVQTIQQVNDWVRRGDPVFKSFVKTARDVIQKSRKVRETYWDAPPARFKDQLLQWSPTDLTFIQYLQHALRPSRMIQEDPYDLALPIIIKAIGMYRELVVDTGVAQLVLIELGVHTPWEDIVTRAPDLRLDMEPPGMSREAQTMNEYVQHAVTKPDAPILPTLQRKLRDIQLEGPTELLSSDPLEAQRHDFGDLPVYIVDDQTAQELDDGVSIEGVSGQPGNYWVHVHVADPTAVIPPGHILDLQAKKNVLTFYSSHRTWPMLPSALTKALFSLGAKGNAGQEVLTFSFKMSDKTEILDYNVRAGFVRNLRVLTYDQVDRFLGLSHSHQTYPFLGDQQPTVSINPVPETFRSDLQKLRDLADRFCRRTLDTTPIINFTFPKAVVRFRSELPTNPLLPSRPILWKGYPSMTYVIENQEQTPHGFRQTVAEWMKLACRVASRFCRDRGLPAMRRRSVPPAEASPGDMDFLISIRDAYGFVDPFEYIKRNTYAPPGGPSLSPCQHYGIGVPEGEGYCRVTSPLRRYSDLMMHWQIKHALIPGNDRPLFSEEYMAPLMLELHEKERALFAAEQVYGRHWSATYLDRYIQGERRKHGPDYEPFPELIGKTSKFVGFDHIHSTGHVPVIIPSLGVHGVVKGIDPESKLPIGTPLAIKFQNFKLGIPTTLQLESMSNFH